MADIDAATSCINVDNTDMKSDVTVSSVQMAMLYSAPQTSTETTDAEITTTINHVHKCTLIRCKRVQFSDPLVTAILEPYKYSSHSSSIHSIFHYHNRHGRSTAAEKTDGQSRPWNWLRQNLQRAWSSLLFGSNENTAHAKDMPANLFVIDTSKSNLPIADTIDSGKVLVGSDDGFIARSDSSPDGESMESRPFHRRNSLELVVMRNNSLTKKPLPSNPIESAPDHSSDNPLNTWISNGCPPNNSIEKEADVVIVGKKKSIQPSLTVLPEQPLDNTSKHKQPPLVIDGNCSPLLLQKSLPVILAVECTLDPYIPTKSAIADSMTDSNTSHRPCSHTDPLPNPSKKLWSSLSTLTRILHKTPSHEHHAQANQDSTIATSRSADTINIPETTPDDATASKRMSLPHTTSTDGAALPKKAFRFPSWHYSYTGSLSKHSSSADSNPSKPRSVSFPPGPIQLPEISSGPPITFDTILPFTAETSKPWDKSLPTVPPLPTDNTGISQTDYRNHRSRTLSNNTLDNNDNDELDELCKSAKGHAIMSDASYATTNCAFDVADQSAVLQYLGYNNNTSANSVVVANGNHSIR
ncbi:expressed protein [Batrachochytrium dendrobatidis JAM81]|uniref:Expressed protein n=2 Tax=Batrachochytrium dendrobatidis TaxID=109871 RepID=F4NUC1_BATDJ|nr:uncharacterized protein BATDEDRAFT_34032 [Batrachochytrium dendrobatidis JAM81]EGF83176.1 expressed protein [Batrachochytrium dendrobatidis JAM81]OAJ36376.1 hypothetical protein BDEG_20555 [Batrachochytrium dendrobatidis JEL423]|eukprot:XP_006675730.1 expressed protein [Batrachochytrium dendrobatidis JAM81]